MGNYLSILTGWLKNWYDRDTDEKLVDGWSIHNEYMMKEIFNKFNKSGHTKDLVLDIKKQLEDINELDCPFQKTLKLKDFSVALDTLIGK